MANRSEGLDARPKLAKLTNHELVTLAVYLVGGDSKYVDTEDVAFKANELAPGRFTWRKYKDQINLDTVRKRLWDAITPEHGGFLKGSEKKGWLLTEAGLRFAQEHIATSTQGQFSRAPLSVSERKRYRNERIRMLASEAYLKVSTGQINGVSDQEAKAFFRVDDYITGESRELKISRTLNLFGDDPELGEVVKQLAKKVRSSR